MKRIKIIDSKINRNYFHIKRDFRMNNQLIKMIIISIKSMVIIKIYII
jgi:hypothetical protein